MNEGPYLADWVFHHLYFGFDAVEIWTNRTEDPSAIILGRLHDLRGQVSFQDADWLQDDSVERGRYFQYEAYTRMADAAAREGYSHVAFLDLDEYWVPRDFASLIRDFLPERRAVNVVSFPWCFDVADEARQPFGSPFDGRLRVQLDAHVKSVVRPDDRVVQYRPHTARTRAGLRMLLREPFPLQDKKAQQWGSLVQRELLESRWGEVPEAFVLHTIHRSEREYVASLRKAPRRTVHDSAYRFNRGGFIPLDRPVLALDLPSDRVAAYLRAREHFMAEVEADPLASAAVRIAQTDTFDRAELVVAEALSDATLMEQLRGALRGTGDPRLDQAYPDWDVHLEGHVDQAAFDGGLLVVTGWVFADDPGRYPARDIELAMRDEQGRMVRVESLTWLDRPDVIQVFRRAPVRCGFRATFPLDGSDGLLDVATARMVARTVGAGLWSAVTG